MESKSQKLRLDHFLVQKGIAPTRSKAQELIDENEVEIFLNGSWQPAKSSSQSVVDSQEVRLTDPQVLKYVSRGGRKLEGALTDFAIDVKGRTVLDLGQSTGGFTDCLLQNGATRVVGVDVGHDQLHAKLRTDSRVTFFEGLHIQDLSQHATFKSATPANGFDLVVADLSFISVLSVLDLVLCWGKEAVLLIKPQFEQQKKQMVFDEKMFQTLREQATVKLRGMGWELCAVSLAKIRGKDGNQEFFIHAKNL